jgi:hypothetical protein
MKNPDWKGIAALIGALLAVAGFVWNKAEGCAQANRSDRVQAASYDAVAQSVGALSERVSALEQAMIKLPGLFTKKQAEAEKAVSSVKRMPSPPEANILLTAPEVLFQKSGLPEFKVLKEEAAE